MNRSLLRPSLALVVALAAGAARADTAFVDFTVSANVKKTCTIAATPISVGDYDPVVANATAAVTGTGTVTVTCTKNLPYAIGLGAGLRGDRTMRNTANADTLSYELFQDDNMTVWDGANRVTGQGAGKTAIPHTVNMTVPGGQDLASEGLYEDTVTATVEF